MYTLLRNSAVFLRKIHFWDYSSEVFIIVVLRAAQKPELVIPSKY